MGHNLNTGCHVRGLQRFEGTTTNKTGKLPVNRTCLRVSVGLFFELIV